ncbi:MAG TPA: ATP-dependent DNA helicase UvrD2 [Acidimicrobiales bacterium]|nr:ATP-dependent DNA helicase UvrD2 [Acidimicrobiales bacterium]
MQLLEGLDPAQHDAVMSDAAPMCILAGAGSGKTRVLTHRIAHRIATGSAEAAHVLALTFSRKAGAELRSRLAAAGIREPLAAGTFHALAYAQLRRRWADRGERPPVLLERKARLLVPLLPRARAAGKASATLQLGDLATEIEWAKARMVTPSSYEAAVAAEGRTPPVPAATMAGLYERYEHDKRAKGLVDFDDLLVSCATALETDTEFSAAQRWRFRHFFVDEFQDVNPAQFRLLQGWLGGRSDLCVVGDPNQAIYSWNGADPSLLTQFARHFPTAGIVRLDRNYRSTPEIVTLAAAVLPGAGGAVAARDSGPSPIVRQFDTDVAEAQGVARALRRAHRPGVPWSHLAVLARTNAQLVLFEEHLLAAGIPCRHGGAGSLLRQPEVKEALEHLRRAPAASAFTSLLVDIEAMASEGGAGERRLNLEALVRLGRDYSSVDHDACVAGFSAWLAAGTRGDEAAGIAGQHGHDMVELTTFHRAKGLEWPVVFVTGLEKGLVPIGHADSPEAHAEERRLLYVALSRAVEELHCTWAQRRTFGSRSMGRTPSPWLEDVIAAVTAMADAGPGAGPAEWKARIAAERVRLQSAPRAGRRARPPGAPAAGANADPKVLDALKAWRSDKARASGVPAYVIFHDSTLAAVAEARPSSRDELLALPGLGPVKAERYGETLLALLAAIPA